MIKIKLIIKGSRKLPEGVYLSRLPCEGEFIVHRGEEYKVIKVTHNVLGAPPKISDHDIAVGSITVRYLSLEGN